MLYRIHPTYIPSVYHMFARIMNSIGQEATGQAELTKFNQVWFGESLRELDSMVYANEPPAETDGESSSQNTVSTELPGSQRCPFWVLPF